MKLLWRKKKKEKTMDEWKEIIEGGQVFWVHNELGNVLKAGEDVYISMMPMICRLGPFSYLEEAKSALTRKQELKKLIDEYNDQLLNEK